MSIRNALVLVAALLLMSVPAFANTLCVDPSNPACFVTIQSAINASASGDTINIAAGTYFENLTITSSLTLNGTGSGATFIDGNNANRVVTISGGSTLQVHFSDLTVQNGRANIHGGGIGNGDASNATSGATLTLTNVVVTSNHAGHGGGGGSNQQAGGIYTNSPTTIVNSTISNNSSDGDAGGIFINGTVGTITGSTISGNTAGDTECCGFGAGIGNGGTLTVLNSTISGNHSFVGQGGGIGNGGPLTLSFVTITNNIGSVAAGVDNFGPAVNIKNSIIANNTGNDCSGNANNNLGGNINGDGSCGFISDGPAALNLGPLQINAPGTTATEAIISPSDAIGAAADCKDALGNTVLIDQRGAARAQVARCDAGAYTFNVAPQQLWNTDYVFEYAGPRSFADTMNDSVQTTWLDDWRFGILADPNGTLSSPTITVNPNTAAVGTLTAMPTNILNTNNPPFIWSGANLAANQSLQTQLNSNVNPGAYPMGFSVSRNLSGGRNVSAGDNNDVRTLTVTVTPTDPAMVDIGTSIYFNGFNPVGTPVSISNASCTAPTGFIQDLSSPTSGPRIYWQVGGGIPATALPVNTSYTVTCTFTIANSNAGLAALYMPSLVESGELQSPSIATSANSYNYTPDPSAMPADPLGTTSYSATPSGLNATLQFTSHFERTVFLDGQDQMVQAPSTTTVSLDPTSNQTYGQLQSIDVQLTGTAGPLPGGNLSITVDTGTSTNAPVVVGGTTVFGLGSLPIGPHSVYVSYGGDANYIGSSSSVSFTVNRANPLYQVQPPAPYAYGMPSSVIVTFQTSGNQVGPTGTVTYQIDNGTSTTVNVGNNGPGTSLQIPIVPVGPHTMTLSYSGDSHFNPLPNVTTNFSVTPATPGIGINTAGSNVTFGNSSSVLVNVFFPNGASAPSGTVTVTYTGPVNGQATATLSSGQATVNLGVLQGGSYSVNASYPGDSNYNSASTSQPSTVTIGPANQTITITSPTQNQQIPFTASPITLAATASSGLTPITWTVNNGPVSINGSTLTFSGTGPVSLVAHQAGNNNFSSAIANVSFNITQVATHLSNFGAPNMMLGDSFNVGVPVTALDTFGHGVTAGGIPVQLTLTGPAGFTPQVFNSTTSFGNGTAFFNINEGALPLTGNYTFTATSPGLTSSSAPFNVFPLVLGFTPQIVGHPSTPDTIGFAIEGSGPVTVASVEVLTQGVVSQDFTYGGGTCLNATLNPGASCSVTVNFTPQGIGQRAGAVTLLDASGNTIQEVLVSGTGQGAALALSPATQATAGSNVGQPQGLIFDDFGNLYIADSANNQIIKVAPGGAQTPFSLGSVTPAALAIGNDGTIGIVDSVHNQLVTIQQNGSQKVQSLPPGSHIADIATDNRGNFYIADDLGNQILAGTEIGQGDPAPFATGLNGPKAVVTGPGGTVAVADTGNNRVLIFTGGAGSAPTSTIDIQAPDGLSVDAAGDFYVSSSTANTLTEILVGGGTVNIPVTGLNGPLGIALDANGNIFIADTGNGRVVELNVVAPTLTFPQTAPGAQIDETFSAQNVGNVGANVISITDTTPGSIFLPQGGTCTPGLILNPGLTCTKDVKFAPSGPANPINGSVTLTYQGRNSLGISSNFTAATMALIGSSTQLTQTVSFTLASLVTFGATPITLVASASSGLPVTFSVSGPATLNGNVLTITGAGTVIVTANQAGNTTYTPGSMPQTLIVNQATPSITWPTPGAITYGAPLGGSQLDAMSSIAGTFTYTPLAGTILGAGNQTLSVTFTPADTTDYKSVTSSVGLAVAQATPVISWSPASLTYGSALTAAQLNATASVPGMFTYTPALGTVLDPGNQTVSVTFTPADTVDYTSASLGVSVRVVVSSTLYVTSTACNAAVFSGNQLIDSFDSSVGAYSKSKSTTGGNISVNGGTTLSGNATIDGVLSAVNPTVGNCSSGHDVTLSGNANVAGGYSALTPIRFATPGPFTAGTADVTVSGNNSQTLSAGNYRNITVSGNGTLTLNAGTYNINSINVSGNGKLIVVPSGGNGVVFNVVGSGPNTPITLTGNAVGDPAGIAANFLINYGGTAALSLTGNADTYGVVYAPNAAATLSGNGDWFGSMVVHTLNDSGNGRIHFDRSLGK